MIWTILSHKNKSTAFRHQSFITKRGVLISCLDFLLSQQAEVSHLARHDEQGFRLVSLAFFHHDEQKIEINQLAVKYDLDDSFS